jgi:hypothetical protein
VTKGKPWKLEISEVSWGIQGSARTLRKKRRLSRELDARSLHLKLTHTPTGIGVEGAIPEGNYSRGAMKAKRNALFQVLFSKLEQKVARHLKIPRR